MRKITIISLSICFVILLGCKKNEMAENPLLNKFETPFGVPPFDKIDTSDYIPAYEIAIKMKYDEIEKIINNKEEATFENTILALDRSGRLLVDIDNIFSNLNSANSNEQMQVIARKLDPVLSKLRDDIYLNENLFNRVKHVYENSSSMDLDPQQIRVIWKYFRDFERRGANLSPADKEELRKINAELSMLSLNFRDNLLAETSENFKLIIDDSADLEGLPEDMIALASQKASEAGLKGWLFTLDKPSLIPFLQYSKKRELREKLYRGYFMRGDNNNENDNKEIAARIIELRIRKAHLLGFETYAHYILDDNMAKTPQNVYDFLMQLWEGSIAMSKKEVAEMQKIIAREGENFELEPWDWWYYAEIVRKEKFDLNEQDIKPYLSLEGVRNGMFEVANKLYGVTFAKRNDLPVYAENVETFEVKEADGKPVGILYLDYFPRSGKTAGAWCTEFRSAIWKDGERTNPVTSIVCNFTPPAGDVPSLLTWDETLTLFHEFGHALHSLFTEGEYYRTAGWVPRDYVEMPSQIMENWASEPEVLKVYAKHYKTGQTMPDELIEKISNSRLFNQGFETVEYVAASILDMDYHTLKEDLTMSVDEFEKKSMDKAGLIDEILPRYRTTYFAHIFSWDYAAGYYSYIWSAVLDADAFNAFKESGDLYNKELAAKFRKHCLAESGNDEGMVQYLKFRGKEPDVNALLERRGLK